jgi:hypothetical protein
VPKNQYDWAQVCPNGHVITASAGDSPEFRREFCENCGQKSLDACRRCRVKIPGIYGFFASSYRPPFFCGNCGTPFPWTEARQYAAKAMAQEIEELDPHDRALFAASIDEISADGPMTDVAVLRIKKILKKVPGQLGEGLKRATIEVATESAKRLLVGQ